MDTLSTGRVFRCLTVIDEFSRECLALHVAHSIPTASVIEVLERLREERGLPERVICDNGSEFTSRAFDAWAYSRRNLSTTMGHSTGLIREQCPVW